jgi:hypothetical protein
LTGLGFGLKILTSLENDVERKTTAGTWPMKITNKTNVARAVALTGVLMGLLLTSPAVRGQANPLLIPNPPILQNGDFETGNLTGWTNFVTANGNVGSGFGLPDVVAFDVAGTGTASDAAQFQAGQVSFNRGDSEGGGIYQIFNCPAGQYTISADIAAQNDYSLVNGDAGLFTLLINGLTVTSVQLGASNRVQVGAINPGQILRGTLDATVTLNQGSNEISLEITRIALNGNVYGQTPVEYLDNIQVTPTPEPSVIELGLLGLFLLWGSRKSRTA